NGVEQRLSRAIKIGANAFAQTFDAKLATILCLGLDDAVGEKEKDIARRKSRLDSLKLRVWNDPYRRPGGIRAQHCRLHFSGTSACAQRRWVTSASETRVPHSDIDHTVEHRYEHERASLLQDSGELAVQLREEPTG